MSTLTKKAEFCRSPGLPLAGAGAARAQYTTTTTNGYGYSDPEIRQTVARLAYISGDVSFARGDDPDDWQPANPNIPMTLGDRTWTAGGRLELQVHGGNLIRLAPVDGSGRAQPDRRHQAVLALGRRGLLPDPPPRRRRGLRSRHAQRGDHVRTHGRLPHRRAARTATRACRSAAAGPSSPRAAARSRWARGTPCSSRATSLRATT